MSRHEISGSVPRTMSEGQEIRIPLNTAKFRAYRDMQRVTAIMGATMTLGFCAFPAMLLYIWVMEPKHPDLYFIILGAVLSLWLPLFVGMATLPAMQVAKVLSQTMDENLPALIVNREGVWDYSSNYVFGFIPWSDIKEVIVASRHARNLNRDFTGIAFVAKSENVLLRRKPGLMGSWLSMDPEITRRHQVFVPQGRIAMPIEDVVEQINDFRAKMIAS